MYVLVLYCTYTNAISVDLLWIPENTKCTLGTYLLVNAKLIFDTLDDHRRLWPSTDPSFVSADQPVWGMVRARNK